MDNKIYEIEFGIHATLAHLEDVIFEGLPNEVSKNWPIDFVSSINVGADLSLVFAKFYVRIATDQEHGFQQYTNDKRVHHVADLYKRTIAGDTVSSKEWDDARDAMDAARDQHYVWMSQVLLEILKEEK